MKKKQAKTIIWKRKTPDDIWYGYIEDKCIAMIAFGDGEFLLNFFNKMYSIGGLDKVVTRYTLPEVKRIAQRTLQTAINKATELLGFISENED